MKFLRRKEEAPELGGPFTLNHLLVRLAAENGAQQAAAIEIERQLTAQFIARSLGHLRPKVYECVMDINLEQSNVKVLDEPVRWE